MNRTICNIICCLIPNQKKRHQFRNKHISKPISQEQIEALVQKQIAKARKVEKFFYSYLKSTFQNGYANILYIRYLENIPKGREFLLKGKFFNGKFWLLYILSLLLLGNKKLAKDEFKEYSQEFPLEGIEFCLPIANLANQLGFTNPQIEKSAYIYKEIQKNTNLNILKKILKDKTIAIVGNSPCQIGKNLGKEIDSHDIVIRMNNYKIEGFEKDYGTKTNIYARGCAPDVKYRDFSEYQAIIVPLDFDNVIISSESNFLDFCCDALKQGKYVIGSSTKSMKDLKKRYPIWPTTGLTVIWEIYQALGSLKNVDFYGFNFLMENPDTHATHYFNDRDVMDSIKKSHAHNFLGEADFLKKFIETLK